jgi:hypothetical protein
LWEYRPDFTQPLWRAGATRVEAIREEKGGLVAQEGKTGVIIWTIRSPYILVGGRLDVEGAGARFKLSWDGDSWHDVACNLDGLFPPEGPARYQYYLKCEFSGDAHLQRLGIINDLQMAPLTLPSMGVGSNAFAYTDETMSRRRVRITHQWVERSDNRPPVVPPEPIYPPAAREAEGSEILFLWQPAADPEGDAIADYHFELSARPDMKWPLSMSFAKLISRTADAGQARYALAGPGLLNPNREYYWHVRARDDKGVWGPWSPTWSFTARGPASPRDVRLEFDREQNRGVLRWVPIPLGRKPVAYRVYASDEKGFTASDLPYKVAVGVSEKLPSEFPGNFVVETSTTELEVVGPHVQLPGANKAFYRVVAVDAAGKRSGASDYAASPRPVIVSAPVSRAQKGVEYRYPLAAIRSLGDLRTRVVNGKETMNFWDVERLHFEIQRGPQWLSIAGATGLLSGTPDRPGSSEVVVSVTLERDVRRLDEEALKWGVEKVVSSGTETFGSATQSFVIEVGP